MKLLINSRENANDISFQDNGNHRKLERNSFLLPTNRSVYQPTVFNLIIIRVHQGRTADQTVFSTTGNTTTYRGHSGLIQGSLPITGEGTLDKTWPKVHQNRNATIVVAYSKTK